jgi:hypothetical protein
VNSCFHLPVDNNTKLIKWIACKWRIGLHHQIRVRNIIGLVGCLSTKRRKKHSGTWLPRQVTSLLAAADQRKCRNARCVFYGRVMGTACRLHGRQRVCGFTLCTGNYLEIGLRCSNQHVAAWKIWLDIFLVKWAAFLPYWVPIIYSLASKQEVRIPTWRSEGSITRKIHRCSLQSTRYKLCA